MALIHKIKASYRILRGMVERVGASILIDRVAFTELVGLAELQPGSRTSDFHVVAQARRTLQKRDPMALQAVADFVGATFCDNRVHARMV